MDAHWVQFQEELNALTQRNGMSIRVFDLISGNPYDIFHKIGFSLKNSGETVSVHKAVKSSSPLYVDSEEITEVALHISWNAPESNIVVRRLKGLEVSHDNVLCLKNDFLTSGNVYIAVYPRMDFSMRTLLNHVYQKGMPEYLVAIVLGEVFKGINYLHEEESKYIYNLNSGTVYCKVKKLDEVLIKIGYGCAIYEHASRAHPKMHQNHLDFSKICEWGSAPEIVSNYSRYSKKAEIWLVGLLGLDLYLGGIRAKNRDDFLDLLERVLWQKRKRMGAHDGWNLSYNFRDFLKKCLHKNLHKRHGTEELLKHPFVCNR